MDEELAGAHKVRCPAILSGSQFISSVLAHIDCQAQTIGTLGYGALAAPGSPAITALLALLTIFVALFGLRLMFRKSLDGADAVDAAIRVGIVLTLAMSWPAWRILGHDLVMNGPSQLVVESGKAVGLPGMRLDLNRRLQRVDDGIVALTAAGTGRLTGGIAGSSDVGDSARGIAIADQTGFGWGRLAYLASSIAPIGLVRIASGILLSLAPLMAGLLLFTGTTGLFAGWLRALFACALAGFSLTLCLGIELSILESWLSDVFAQRENNLLVPAAPTELLGLTVAFSLISWGIIALIIKLVFFQGLTLQPARLITSLANHSPRTKAEPQGSLGLGAASSPGSETSRAFSVAAALSRSMHRENHYAEAQPNDPPSSDRLRSTAMSRSSPIAGERLGTSFRRTRNRHSAPARQRDQ